MSHIRKTSLMERNQAFNIQPIEEWESKILSIKNVSSISSSDAVVLTKLLDHCDSKDSYLNSPAYYLLTCREGLWLYQDGASYVLFGWHPNVQGQILIFPPQNKNYQALKKLLGLIPIPPAGIRIARIAKPDLLQNLSAGLYRGREIILSDVKETILDWQYPVRILSSTRVVEQQGGAYMRIRNHIKQAEKRQPVVYPLSIEQLRSARHFVYLQTALNTKQEGQFGDVVTFYNRAFDIFHEGQSGLKGMVFSVEEHLEALVMWDITEYPEPTLNIYVNLCNTRMNGLSEYVMHMLAREALEKNIHHINLGGSETKSLDDYKNKFVPAYSLDLTSIDVSIRSKSCLSRMDGGITNVATA